MSVWHVYSASEAPIATVVKESSRACVARIPALFAGADVVLDGLKPTAGDVTILPFPEFTVPVPDEDEELLMKTDALFSPVLDFLPLHTGWIEEHCIVALTIEIEHHHTPAAALVIKIKN